MTKHLKFENPGMGIGLASDWFEIKGKKFWVSFMSIAEGKGQRRKWMVTATHYGEDRKPIRVSAMVANGFRYEATDLALAELSNHIN